MVSQKDPRPFITGMTYWPRRKGLHWWESFDRSEVQEECAHIAALGFQSIRFALRWEDFQPTSGRVNTYAFRALEQALNAANDAQLQVVITLFPLTLQGGVHIPDWVSRPNPIHELRQLQRSRKPSVIKPAALQSVIYKWGYHYTPLQDVFGNPALRDAQTYFVRELVGYFGTHPAILAWQLGEGLEYLHKPDAIETIYQWYTEMVLAIRDYTKIPIWGSTLVRGLTLPIGPRPGHMAELCDAVVLSLDQGVLLRRQAQDLPALLFLYQLTSALVGASVRLMGCGQATTPDSAGGWIRDEAFGTSLHTYLASYEEQADYVGSVLSELQRVGAPGVWLSDYADYTEDVQWAPSLDTTIYARTRGLIDSNGNEKPLADTIKAFTASQQAVHETTSNPFFDIDIERYWHNPKSEFERLWNMFQEEY
ncbi:MAG: hypothetical protein AAGF95_04800 [Chloroflexota bacterium]